MNEPKTKTNKKYFINIALLLIFTVGSLVYLLKDDFNEVVETVANANWLYIGLALLLMLLYYLLEGVIITVFARIYKRSYSLWKGFLNGMVGVFFSGITPSSTGGQFAQAYTFGKQGIKVSNAASILMMNFIVYQIVLVFYVIATLFGRFNYYTSIMPSLQIFGWDLSFLALTLIGFTINAVVVFGLFFISYSKLLHQLVLVYGVSFLGKLHIIKDVKKVQDNAEKSISTFKREFSKLLTNYKVLIIVALLHFAKLTIFYAIPFFALKAIMPDVSYGLFWDCLILSSYLYMITSFFPVPGASGGSETFFVIMFTSLFMQHGINPAGIINSLMLIWRFATFYLGLVGGAFVIFFYHESGTKEFVTMANPKIIITNEMKRINIEELENSTENQHLKD